MNTEQLNEQLKNKFYEQKDYLSLEKYVMSELLSPIEDYYNAVNIICENMDLVRNLNLLYIATYLNSEYKMGHNNLLIKINSMIEKVDDKNKSIIYYLNANETISNNKEWRKDKKCIENLKKSVQLSRDFRFVYNRFYLAQCVEKSLARKLARESLSNVECKHTFESLKIIPQEYWFSSESFIDEFILGVSISDIVYKQKENSLKEKGLI